MYKNYLAESEVIKPAEVVKSGPAIEPGYVFILGLPRTGTTLVRSLLNCSQHVGISMGEARLFGTPRFFGLATRGDFRQKLNELGGLSTQEGVKNIVDYLYREPQNNFWAAIPKNMEQKDFLEKLQTSTQRERTLFETAMVLGANGKPICGEKTPAHIYYVPTLLEWFPTAKVVHMFRDPRAVYVSEKQKYNVLKKSSLSLLGRMVRKLNLVYELYASFDLISNWLRVIRLHHEYQQRYPNNYYHLKYENLVSEPEKHLQELCNFLGVEFTPEMLNQTVMNSSFVSREAQVTGFDTAAINRWHQNIPPVINRWFLFWCKKQLLALGYQI